MKEPSFSTKSVRKFIYDRFLETGRGPNVRQIMEATGYDRRTVLEALSELEEGITLAIEKGTENIRMCHPFGNTTTPHEVEVDGGRNWYAECALESLAVSWLFPGKEVRVHSCCQHCAEPVELVTRDGEILSYHPGELLLHFAVPRRKWQEDLVHA